MHIQSNIPVKYFVSKYLYPYEFLRTTTIQQKQQKSENEKGIKCEKSNHSEQDLSTIIAQRLYTVYCQLFPSKICDETTKINFFIK